MTLWWIGNVVLLAVVLPVVVYLLRGVLTPRRASSRACSRSQRWRPRARRISTQPRCS